jgi:hypothetical protein
MTGGTPHRTAKIVQTLIFYDEPQLMLLEISRGAGTSHMLAVAIDHPPMTRPFFACEARARTYERYFQGKADLRYVFTDAIRERYFFFDLDTAENNKVMLIEATSEEAKNPDFWPSAGLFSRSHTNPFLARAETDAVVKTFKIDGDWGIEDFSYFRSRVSSLHALFTVINALDTKPGASEKEFLMDAIQTRPWRRGGSYVGFYGDLASHANRLSPLKVERIKYASPGEIALRGNEGVFSEIDRLIEVFEKDHRSLQRRYNNLHGMLAKEHLLSAKRTTRFSNPHMQQLVLEQSKALAQTMRLEKTDDIFEACERNTLIFCKVILSIYRRADDLYVYHAEGRVQTNGTDDRVPPLILEE